MQEDRNDHHHPGRRQDLHGPRHARGYQQQAKQQRAEAARAKPADKQAGMFADVGMAEHNPDRDGPGHSQGDQGEEHGRQQVHRAK